MPYPESPVSPHSTYTSSVEIYLGRDLRLLLPRYSRLLLPPIRYGVTANIAAFHGPIEKRYAAARGSIPRIGSGTPAAFYFFPTFTCDTSPPQKDGHPGPHRINHPALCTKAYSDESISNEGENEARRPVTIRRVLSESEYLPQLLFPSHPHPTSQHPPHLAAFVGLNLALFSLQLGMITQFPLVDDDSLTLCDMRGYFHSFTFSEQIGRLSLLISVGFLSSIYSPAHPSTSPRPTNRLRIDAPSGKSFIVVSGRYRCRGTSTDVLAPTDTHGPHLYKPPDSPVATSVGITPEHSGNGPTTVLSEFQRVQEVTRAQAEEYALKSEALLREAVKEAGEVLREAVKILPPEDAQTSAGLVWDGSDMWSLPLEPSDPSSPTPPGNSQASLPRSSRGYADAQDAVATRAESLLRRIDTKAGGIEGDERSTKISALLQEPGAGEALKNTRDTLVPSELAESEFWKRFFFRAHEIEVEEEKRKAIIEGTLEEEDFTWEDGEDDAVALSDAASSTAPQLVQDGNRTLLAPARESSEEGYDVVSSGNASPRVDPKPALTLDEAKDD
ncbi:hypothetical protein Hypma_006991 [Hypsizygus marmoreus]|uniref:BSD domain-containing protein n=1 Tax=Hypsizygus marmoreus TaxID=39966 RepID=A0A369KBZ2_HYPMA|nr:hypothetical protein Hypma_006991 [Hypsizygus marmoreus]